MQERRTFGRMEMFTLAPLLWIQVILLVFCGLDLTRPILLLSYAGLLAPAYLVYLTFGKPRWTRLARVGWLVVILFLLISGALWCASWLASLARISPGQLTDHASALFTLVILLGPTTIGWLVHEELYYQGYLAAKLKRDLGFEDTTNTLEGGRKYLFFFHMQAGGGWTRQASSPATLSWIAAASLTFGNAWRSRVVEHQLR
jgi:hypothetical protein